MRLGVLLFVLPGLWGCWRLPPSRVPPPRSEPSPVVLTDDLGVKVALPYPPQRIVSLAPSLTEVLFALGVGNRIVGVTRYCDYPPEAKGKPKVGGPLDPNLELILAQRPDLILVARGTPMEVVNSLRSTGIPTLGLAPQDWESILATIERLGQATGAHEAARRLVEEMQRRREAVLERVKSLPSHRRPKVLLLVDRQALFTCGPGSFLHQLIEWAGGENIAADAPLPWPQYSMEKVLEKNPDVIVVMHREEEDPKALRQELLSRWREDERWRRVRAVHDGRLEVLPMDELTVPGPRLVKGLELLARSLHPQRFSSPGLGGR